jgi:Lar family restriction alleviation protein
MTQQDDRAVPVSEALKPCPLCGGNELSHGFVNTGSVMWGTAGCETCDLQVTKETEAEAIAAWNIRATQAPARVELREAVKRALIETVSSNAGQETRVDRATEAVMATLTPPAQSSGPGEVKRLREAVVRIERFVSLMMPSLPLDLRRNNEQAIRQTANDFADLRAALTPNASEPQPDLELQEIADGAYGDGPAIRGRARDMLKAQRETLPLTDDCDCKLCDWAEKRTQEQPQPGAASGVDVLTAGPRDCMWRSGHDGAGSDPSRFFCDVIGPAPSCHLYRAVADTEAEARAIAFQKADPSFAATAPTVGNIILVSQDAEPGYQLHGLFRSFKDAANHAAKDEDDKCMPVWSENCDRQQWVTTHTVWVASRQPVRPPAAALSDPQGVRDDQTP